MLLASKVACTGIAFVLLTTGPPALRLTDVASETASNKAMPTIGQWADVKATQQKLSDKGHYRGKVDGVFGLRTRASIRGFGRDTSKSKTTGRTWAAIWIFTRMPIPPTYVTS